MLPKFLLYAMAIGIVQHWHQTGLTFDTNVVARYCYLCNKLLYLNDKHLCRVMPHNYVYDIYMA